MDRSEGRELGCFVNLWHLIKGGDVLETCVSENSCILGMCVLAFVEKE